MLICVCCWMQGITSWNTHDVFMVWARFTHQRSFVSEINQGIPLTKGHECWKCGHVIVFTTSTHFCVLIYQKTCVHPVFVTWAPLRYSGLSWWPSNIRMTQQDGISMGFVDILFSGCQVIIFYVGWMEAALSLYKWWPCGPHIFICLCHIYILMHAVSAEGATEVVMYMNLMNLLKSGVPLFFLYIKCHSRIVFNMKICNLWFAILMAYHW